MKFKLLLSATFLFLIPLMAKDFTNSIGMKFKNIPKGSFMMGTVTKSTGSVNSSERPQHRVKIKSFYMATTEVTQGQWYEVMGNNPAYFKNTNTNMPVESVTWQDAQKFIKKLNKKENTKKYRLPSEEEWEYSARAGSTAKWCFGSNERQLINYAWYGNGMVGKTSHPVAKKKANKWGLYDMHGNVCEWTRSRYSKNYNTQKEHEYKVLRGGSWMNYARKTRCSYRDLTAIYNEGIFGGLRLARTK